jgi:DNA-binding MarR family transcriptional regulator
VNIRPEDTIGFLIGQAHRRIDSALTEVLQRCVEQHGGHYELTLAQWGLLYLLSQRDGLSIGTISELRRVDAPVVTSVVTRMERSGLVERRHEQQDRRVVRVYLTDEGRDIMRFLPHAAESFYYDLIRDISEEELDIVKGILHHLVTNISPVPTEDISSHCDC